MFKHFFPGWRRKEAKQDLIHLDVKMKQKIEGRVGGGYLDVIGDVDLAGPQVAKARLFDQLTPLVGVGHPERQAAAAAL